MIDRAGERITGSCYTALSAILLACALWGCGSGARQQEASPCANVHCNDHGSCAVEAGTATCSCDAGYRSDGLSCLLADGSQIRGWQLGETNTGLAAAGIDRNTLPLYQPPANEVQYGTWAVPAGTSLHDVRIEVGGIDVSAGDITFERCWFHPTSIGRGMPLVYPPYGKPLGPLPTVIRDSDLDGTGIAWNGDGTNPACGAIAVSSANLQIERCNIRGFGSGVALSGQYEVRVEGSYIHDLVQGEWFLGSGQSHQGPSTKGSEETGPSYVGGDTHSAFSSASFSSIPFFIPRHRHTT